MYLQILFMKRKRVLEEEESLRVIKNKGLHESTNCIQCITIYLVRRNNAKFK